MQETDSLSGNEQNVVEDLHGIPLTPIAARPIMRQLFEKQSQWRRKDLVSEVERIHLQRGGIRGNQDPSMVIKKALQQLQGDGLVENVPNAFGLWRSAGERLDSAVTGKPQPSEDTDELQVLDAIGRGNETVYLYFNPNDRRLAELEGRTEWECKVGRTQGIVTDRILDQGAKTALSHTPVIGLIIKTPDSGALERAIHSALRLADKAIEDSPGTEWFLTSPTKVKRWYEAFEETLNCLQAPDSRNLTA